MLIWTEFGFISVSFPDLFRSLEDHHCRIGVESYGLSMNTLEQVFLRVGEMTGAKNREAEVNQALGVLLKENNNRGSGMGSIGKRFIYLQYKRLIYELINYKSFIFCFLPVIAIIFAASRLANLNQIIESADSVDLLLFPKCGRIGIEKSSGLIDKFKASLPPKSDCIVVEEIDNALDWFERTAMTQRPLILAAIARNNTAGIVVHKPNNQYLGIAALHITLVKALSTQTFSLKMDNRDNPYKGSSDNGPGFNIQMEMFGIMPLMIVFPMMIYRAIGFYVVERSVKFGHQQFLTGLSNLLYWFASFASDCWTFAIYYIGMIICCLIFGLIKNRLLELTPLFLLCSCVSLLKIYIIQRIFTSKIKAENFASLILLIEYIGCAVLYLINLMNPKRGEISTFNFLFDYPYLLDPQVTVMAYYLTGIKNVLTAYLILLAQLAVFFLIFCFLECGPIMRGIERCFTPSLPKNIGNASDSSSSLQSSPPKDKLVDNLVKRYGSKNIAVKGVSFGVMEHECFGLLGVNGAGKTSTFEVLTGNARATAGTATVAGVDCAAPARIGYCPQFDALMEEMSGRQNLLILAALHGYSNPAAVTDTVIECVGMTAHANKTSKSYSGGQRRKISVAGALLAQNSLIILDEPTAGIDPVTRRDIWSVICALRDSTKTAIVLTSHSMDEVEALCSRVAIMKAGLIAAQGSSQTLKSRRVLKAKTFQVELNFRYGNYFKLSLVVPSERAEIVEVAVRDVFHRANPINGSTSTFNFEIPREPGMLWSEMFTSTIKVARILNAKDYCLSQASLEDAFIAIASGEEVKK